MSRVVDLATAAESEIPLSPYGRASANAGKSRNCLAAEQADADRKVFANLQADAALRGYSLTRSADANGRVRFIIGRWNLLRFCDSLQEVEQFLGRAGA